VRRRTDDPTRAGGVALIPDKIDEEVKTGGNYGVFVLTAVAFFPAEMGAKTQIHSLPC
jgi:putative Ca2+/H+ antiporter (TMEM165/GDT1 family)